MNSEETTKTPKDIKKTSSINTATMLSVFAIAISLITIVLFFVKVKESTVVDSGTYISIMATFIGICTTFIIGFQILSILSVDSRIKELNQKAESIDKDIDNKTTLLSKIKKETLKSDGILCFLSAQIYDLKEKDKTALKLFLDAFELFVKAENLDLIGRTLGNIDITLRKMNEGKEAKKMEKVEDNAKPKYFIKDFLEVHKCIKERCNIIIPSDKSGLLKGKFSDIYNQLTTDIEKMKNDSKESNT